MCLGFQDYAKLFPKKPLLHSLIMLCNLLMFLLFSIVCLILSCFLCCLVVLETGTAIHGSVCDLFMQQVAEIFKGGFSNRMGMEHYRGI